MKDIERTETFSFLYSAVRKDDEVLLQDAEESIQVDFVQIEGQPLENVIAQFEKFLLAVGYSEGAIRTYIVNWVSE